MSSPGQVSRAAGDGWKLVRVARGLTPFQSNGSRLTRHLHDGYPLVKLRCLAGLEHKAAAQIMGISRRAADRLWLLARTWLYPTMKAESE